MDKEFGFSFDGSAGERAKFFNIDGSEAELVTVWVEAYDDKRFWMAYIRDNGKYKFDFKIPDEAKSKDGKVANGCDRLFSLEKSGDIVLNKHNIFCLDSDDSFIKNLCPEHASKKSPRSYVYVTNIYSIENAFINEEVLDETFCHSTGCTLGHLGTKPSDLLKALSKYLYPIYIDAYYLEAITKNSPPSTKARKDILKSIEKLKNLSIKEKILETESHSKIESELQSIHKVILEEIKKEGKPEEHSSFSILVKDSGVTSDNILLFIHGHSIFDLVIEIYKNQADTLKEQKVKQIEATHKHSEDEVRGLENMWWDLEKAIKAAFLAKRPETPFLNTTTEALFANYS
ncbi:DUF4435 domain-containing protein [Pseudomonas nitroreducens]|uniref:DUF4435 domain-containing protein n=1 Tax=Pseudomonas nitroreducens TaxID=46680 RepID=UPI001FB6E296|nr:DUF4435 domain-containing protein [Pseudomonas nitroreducens]MCJ1895473.1 DUF4435 domain-containing protein [Pseudomonas nitroreducens]